MKNLIPLTIIAATVALTTQSNPAFSQPVVHTSDFINAADRTGFNGFEGLTANLIYDFTYTEQNIRVERTGISDNVWTSLGAFRGGFEGDRSWHPEPVLSYPIETGYDKITLATGGAFESVGMLVGSGFGGYCQGSECNYADPYLSLHYELLFHGTSVATGTLAHSPNAHYVGFSGGGFDEVRLWDRNSNGGWPDQSALLIDAVETAGAVPEPQASILTLFGIALVLAVARTRARSKQ